MGFRRRADEAGFSLAEMLVSMLLFAMMLAVVATVTLVVERDLRKTTAVADANVQAQNAFDRLDRQLRYAAAVNRAGTGAAGDFYIEFRQDASGITTCTQWRLVRSTGQLQYRSWTAGGSVPGFATVATGVVNTASQPPFTWNPATAAQLNQSVLVDLRLRQRRSDAGLGELQTLVSARNTNSSTATNDGTTQVCMDGGRP